MSTKAIRQAQFRLLKHTKPSKVDACIRLDTEHGETKRLEVTIPELECIMAVLQMRDDDNADK